MNIPTSIEIHQLYQQYYTPVNIQAHIAMVERVAVWLAQQRQQQGNQVNVALVSAAALLHDLVRIPEQWSYLPATIKTPLSHAEINYLLLRGTFPEVAEVVRVHSLMAILSPQPFAKLEQKIVYYADKRVNHSSIVSLADRLRLGSQRWQVHPERDRSTELLTQLTILEQDLFAGLTIRPDQLHVHI